jgi:hypothetical protein
MRGGRPGGRPADGGGCVSGSLAPPLLLPAGARRLGAGRRREGGGGAARRVPGPRERAQESRTCPPRSVARQPLPALRRPHRLPSPTRRRLGPGTREGTVRSHPRPAGAPRSRDLTVASRNRGGRGPERSRMSAHRCRPR